jgi:gliding motility-associated-like protein
MTSSSYGILNYWPSGDITFFNGELYMASGGGIVKIDKNNPTNSTLIIPTTGPIFGLVSVATSLHNNTVYALMYVSESQTDIYELDIDNKKVVGKVGSIPFAVLDAASVAEDGSIKGVKIDKINIHQDCDGPTKGIIEVITPPHTDIFTYTLSNGLSNNTGVFTGLTSGTYQLTVSSVLDSQISSFVVPAYTLTKPQYTVGITNSNCDNPGQISFVADINSAYTIKYGTNSFPLNHIFTGLAVGSYHFEIYNESGCKADEKDVIVAKDKCVIKFNTAINQKECAAFNKGSIQVLTNPHSDIYTYSLNGISNTTGIFNMLDPGSYSVKIVSAEDEINIPAVVPDYQSLHPDITYAVNNPACAIKGSIKFDIKADISQYKIKYGLTTYPFDHLFTDMQAGIYHFIVLNKDDCLIDEYDVKLDYQPCPVVINNVNVVAECNVLGKAALQVNVEPIPETLTYKLKNTTNTTGIFNMLSPGIYTFTVTASGGNSQTQTVLVPDFSLNKPFTTFKQVNPICTLTGQINFTVGTNAALYDIEYNSTIYPSDYIFKGLYAGNYHFSILKNDGCIADAIDVTLVEEACNPVSFPTAFTPNQDGVNDIFRADPLSKATNYRIQIFNRWGEVMFATTNVTEGWNGDYKGKSVPTGIYYYIATYTTQENKSAMLKGSITVLR